MRCNAFVVMQTSLGGYFEYPPGEWALGALGALWALVMWFLIMANHAHATWHRDVWFNWA